MIGTAGRAALAYQGDAGGEAGDLRAVRVDDDAKYGGDGASGCYRNLRDASGKLRSADNGV